MDDQAQVARPHRLRNGTLEKGGDHQIRGKKRNRFFGDRIGNVKFDTERVAALAQLAKQPLAEAVKACLLYTSRCV